MTIDELIDILQEAKEHGILGGREVIITDEFNMSNNYIKEVVYDNKNLFIKLKYNYA